MVGSQHKFVRLCNVTYLKAKYTLWRMFCVGFVISAWAAPHLIRCSAGACCEQCFGQERGTNDPVTGTVNLPVENWPYLPEVILN